MNDEPQPDERGWHPMAGEEGDSFEAGKLGSFEVGADATVLLGDPYVFDAENIGDFDF